MRRPLPHRPLLPLIVIATLLCGLSVAFGQVQPALRQSKIDGCTVTTSSALCTDKPWSIDLTVENTSLTAIVACAFNATAILNDKSSFIVYPGRLKSWTATRGPAPPSGPLYCISSASGASVRVEYY